MAGNVLVASSTQVADPAGPQLDVAVLVDQQLGQLVETLPALETPEAAVWFLQSLVKSPVSLQLAG